MTAAGQPSKGLPHLAILSHAPKKWQGTLGIQISHNFDYTSSTSAQFIELFSTFLQQAHHRLNLSAKYMVYL